MKISDGFDARRLRPKGPSNWRLRLVAGIAALLASLAAGWLWDREGSSATFIASAGVAAAALAMLSLLQEERRT